MNPARDFPKGAAVDLSKIMSWYLSHCDGNWEHDFGVSITTLDNPGWLIRVNLRGTDLEPLSFETINEGCDESCHPQRDSWIHCYVRDHEFVGASDPSQLPRLIEVFNGVLDAAYKNDKN